MHIHDTYNPSRSYQDRSVLPVDFAGPAEDLQLLGVCEGVRSDRLWWLNALASGFRVGIVRSVEADCVDAYRQQYIIYIQI